MDEEIEAHRGEWIVMHEWLRQNLEQLCLGSYIISCFDCFSSEHRNEMRKRKREYREIKK